ncbi:DinB family protein [Alkalibacillus silvisoli]|uniref:Damage-inducible protein DinB n=1 Tax=Alkalibacillus silvisoli TaxID=392823 RepID=A0ABP3JZN4_9BACI
MNTKGLIYAANMTNILAKEVPESCWDLKLVTELGTLRKLFTHMIRVRDVYRDGLKTGIIQFPGELPLNESSITYELERSTDELVAEFKQAKFESIKMGPGDLTTMELLATAIQHEGIHQGQYAVAFKQSGLTLPKQWVQDWRM